MVFLKFIRAFVACCFITELTCHAIKAYHRKFAAGVAKLVYALDSKSSGLNAHVGSSPTSGTTRIAVTASWKGGNRIFDVE